MRGNLNYKEENGMNEAFATHGKGASLELNPHTANTPRKDNKTALSNYEPLNLYFHDLKRYKLLSKEKEVELAKQISENKDTEAFNKLVTSNLRLVAKIAIDFQKQWSQNVLDLIQEGNLGLLQAAAKFDPHRGIRFSYYASFWIRAYMLKYIMDNWKVVKIGTTQAQRKLFFNLNKEREKLIAQGIPPEPSLLAERLGVKEKDVIEVSQRMRTWDVSTNTPIGDDSDEPYETFLIASSKDTDDRLSEMINRKRLTNKLKGFRKTLMGREAEIYDKRILADQPETLQEIGDKYQISRERVRQIQNKLNLRIKEWLNQQIPNFESEYSELMQS